MHMPSERKPAARRLGQALKQMNHQDLASSGFWVSQICLIIATVIGVYLAAQAGLEQALRFDQIDDWQNRYYLQRSLHEELRDNVRVIRRYADEVLAQQPSTAEIQRNRPQVNRFVWETMRFSPTTLETPTEFLMAARRFYSLTEDIIRKAEARTYGAAYAAELLGPPLARMHDDVLPRLEAHYTALARQLAESGVHVDHDQGGTR